MTAEVNAPQPLRVIVSGGIGSGKSTVSEILRQLGAVVIEADRIGHAVLEPGGAAYERVARRWPAAVQAGRINRQRLAAIVFTDTEQLAALEALTHPHIRAEIHRQVAAAADRDIAVELPVAGEPLGEGWIRLVIDAPDALRLQRTVARGMGADDAASRLAIQPDREQWRAGADVVVVNEGTLADLEAEVRRVWEALRRAGGR